jgi:hypothetical protein
VYWADIVQDKDKLRVFVNMELNMMFYKIHGISSIAKDLLP